MLRGWFCPGYIQVWTSLWTEITAAVGKTLFAACCREHQKRLFPVPYMRLFCAFFRALLFWCLEPHGVCPSSFARETSATSLLLAPGHRKDTRVTEVTLSPS